MGFDNWLGLLIWALVMAPISLLFRGIKALWRTWNGKKPE
jgi:hypothetical protein